MKLKNKYEKIVEQYLIAFVDKQELDILKKRVKKTNKKRKMKYFTFNELCESGTA